MWLSHGVRRDTMLVCPITELSFSAPTGHHRVKCTLFCLTPLESGKQTLCNSILTPGRWVLPLVLTQLYLTSPPPLPIPLNLHVRNCEPPPFPFFDITDRECHFYPTQYTHQNSLSLDFFCPYCANDLIVQEVYELSGRGKSKTGLHWASPPICWHMKSPATPLPSHKQKLYSHFL